MRNVACNLDTGICEVNLDVDLSNYEYKAPVVKDKVLIEYFTDPLCSACFAFEPVIAEMKEMFKDQFEFKNVLGGMMPKNPYVGDVQEEMAANMENMGEMFNMPISGKVMREYPVDSSYPPSLAYLAAKIQDEDKAEIYLRKLREFVYVLDKDISKESVLVEIAKELDLDIDKFLADFYNPELLSELEDDIAYTMVNGVRGFPSIVIYSPENESTILRGIHGINDYVDALKKFKLEPLPKVKYELSDILRKDHFLSLREIADKLDLYFADDLEAELLSNPEVIFHKVNDGYYFKAK